MIENEENKTVLLTIKEASKIVKGLSQYHIRMLVKSGRIPSIRAGRKYFINKAVLLRYISGGL